MRCVNELELASPTGFADNLERGDRGGDASKGCLREALGQWPVHGASISVPCEGSGRPHRPPLAAARRHLPSARVRQRRWRTAAALARRHLTRVVRGDGHPSAQWP